ncbi:MAG: GNAT family N-acetyltransferase [Alphaproteobacteria bacterium]|nr:GNAT family N-acetyltransferase [Alphaproteobacteria bacterium]
MEIVDVTDRNSNLLEKLTALWRRSVIKTHTFLTGTDIAEIEDYVPQALKSVEHLAVAQNNGDYLGFMGVEQHRLEMLFLDPRYIGQGVGRKLVEYGVEKHQISEVTVNEQNPYAVGFYEHLGFKTYKRTATDEQGRPFPLLYMRCAK